MKKIVFTLALCFALLTAVGCDTTPTTESVPMPTPTVTASATTTEAPKPMEPPQFRLVKRDVRPFTTLDKYVNPDDYAAVREEYVLWFFTDERGEERYLFEKADIPREKVTYWLPGKNPDYNTVFQYANEHWYEDVVFEIPGKTVVGLPADAERVTEWYWMGEWDYVPDDVEGYVRESFQNYLEIHQTLAVSGGKAQLVNRYVQLGGCCDLDGDGVYEETGWDENGDGITDTYYKGKGSGSSTDDS